MSLQAPPITGHPADPARRSHTVAALLAITGLVIAGVVLALVVGLAPSGSPRAALGTKGPVVPGAALASGITSMTHGRAHDVSCPDLPARAGASVVCAATVDGAPAHVRTTITSINGTHAQYDFVQVP